ncbi:P-loop containing nucleoside triphosphate hydrolase protein [Geopyxis carbonaria]|nr:P-loop containing nucleoside triphosphate hydrolase protein [Geopyxis carbonaria]
MKLAEAEGWKWFLEHIFVETKYIFEGLIFPSIEFKGKKRAFKVENISPKGGILDTNSDSEETFVSAFRFVESSTVELVLDPSLEHPVSSPIVEEKPSATATVQMPKSSVTFDSIGGLKSQIKSIRTLLISILEDSDEFSRKGLVPPRGVLLYGPPGTGKSLLLKAVASELNAKAFVLDGSVMGKYMGESEAAIRKIFADAKKNQPSIIFMDEVDSLAPKRSSGDGSEGRVVATLLTEMDGIEALAEDGKSMRIAVVAATNRPNAIDEALRRAGRFEKELEIGIPDVDARKEILELFTRQLSFENRDDESKDSIISGLAGRTHGYVGADLYAVIRNGLSLALERRRLAHDAGSGHMKDQEIFISQVDLETAMKDIKPTAMREIFIEPPKVRWSDIGGQEEVKQRLREAVEWPLTHPEVFARLGGTPRKGLLLYGPPGCSKTLTAKALATEAGLNFMAVKGPEIFSMYVGESERAVREIFRKARAASPSIIFFDEIDALSASREGKSGGGVNVLTSLLNEMDGIETLKNVVVLAATNRPEIIDPALMRPGRLDTILYVGPPDLEARREILRIKMKKMSIASDIDIGELAERTNKFSGAEIVNVCDEAIHYAMRESFEIEAVGKRHFEMALEKAVPQITDEMRWKYENWSVGGVKKI